MLKRQEHERRKQSSWEAGCLGIIKVTGIPRNKMSDSKQTELSRLLFVHF